MEPVISPWVFYLIHIVSSLRSLGILALYVLVLCGILLLAIYDDSTKERNKECLKRVACGLAIFFAVVCAFVPSKDTMYQMVVAHYATQNNIEYMKDNTVKFIQDVAKAIADENKKEK